MASIEAVSLPAVLQDHQVAGRAVAVFDVLRATSTMTAALAAGVAEIQVFTDVQAAAAAAENIARPRLLCGETRCLRPQDFDLGNSPGAFCHELHHGQVMLMATTNGTRAVIAARKAKALFIGAIVNASAVARKLIDTGLDVTLLCAGTGGEIAMEDLIGAGAVIHAMVRQNGGIPHGEKAKFAWQLFRKVQSDLIGALSDTEGGRNVIEAGLQADIEFCAQLDRFEIVGRVYDEPLRVVAS